MSMKKMKVKTLTPAEYLQSVDPILGAVIAQIEMKPRNKRKPSRFHSLVESIVSQQLSVKASDTIFKRLVALFPGQKFPTPEQVMKIPDAKLRSVGLSGQKVKYIKDLAAKVHAKEVPLHRLHTMTDEAVIEHLIQVKGIGRWTGEMFLMSSLDRLDVFSHGDLGLRNAIQKLYGFKSPPTVKQIEKIIAKWSPYKSLASWCLWKSLDIK